tara:strand:+ start:293 stop:703 length:411 start_codon:yes stop_codon:yes gene_type:complete
MAIRSVATTDTLETLRTTFNSLGTDTGDVATLTTTATNISAAINELNSAVTAAFTIRDTSSTIQQINAGDVFTFAGDSNITATVSATDTMTITLNSTISGLASISGTSINATTTLTEANVRVATRPFAIAQSIALG